MGDYGHVVFPEYRAPYISYKPFNKDVPGMGDYGHVIWPCNTSTSLFAFRFHPINLYSHIPAISLPVYPNAFSPIPSHTLLFIPSCSFPPVPVNVVQLISFIELVATFTDDRWTAGRPVTDLAWSPHHKELFLQVCFLIGYLRRLNRLFREIFTMNIIDL